MASYNPPTLIAYKQSMPGLYQRHLNDSVLFDFQMALESNVFVSSHLPREAVDQSLNEWHHLCILYTVSRVSYMAARSFYLGCITFI